MPAQPNFCGGVRENDPSCYKCARLWRTGFPTRSTNRFHERELARALRAAKKSGTAIDRVEVDPATGRISVVIAKPSEVPTPTASAWDEATEKELKKAKGRARRAT